MSRLDIIMGVTYKLKDEVVQFIISEKQSNPLYSCRQLAESASVKFNLHLSKSSVHDVLKETGIITPRGRKPKDKFQIPQERKKQIQESLSQIKLLPSPNEAELKLLPDHLDPVEQVKPIEPFETIPPIEPVALIDTLEPLKSQELQIVEDVQPPWEPDVFKSAPTPEIEPEPILLSNKHKVEVSEVYEEAGKIFLKAARWDLGIYSTDILKESDWKYYLTYVKGVKIVLANNKDLFIDLPLPLERCIREVVDGLVSNIKPFIGNSFSNEEIFRACMGAEDAYKIDNISIVDCNDRELLSFDNIMEKKRTFSIENRLFVESSERNVILRSKELFFTQVIDVKGLMEEMFKLKGFDAVSKDSIDINIIAPNIYDNKPTLEKAIERINGLFLHDEQGRLLKVHLQE